MIPVTKPYLPDQKKYVDYVNSIFSNQWLTNNGPFVQRFEDELRTNLSVDNLHYVSNGTIALQLAIKALALQGEIITTPFTYVATTSSIVWEGCKPVFVDIDSNTLNIDPDKIEAAISPRTTAIIATHCFGNPCDIARISDIAEKHKLKVIYDAAHCFGVKFNGKSIFSYGDITTTSLHATKIMHSTEGGIVFSSDDQVHSTIRFMRNFGHDGFEKFNGVGINAKNSEFHAAMGLLVLGDINLILERRRIQSQYYDNLLINSTIYKPEIQQGCEYNYSYYPILFSDEQKTLAIKTKLEQKGIYPRRYFYPSLSHLSYVKRMQTPISDNCASRILCLPLFHDLSFKDQDLISKIILKELK